MSPRVTINNRSRLIMEKRNTNSKEDRQVLQYFVAKENITLMRISGKCEKNVNTLRLGMLVEAVEDLGDDQFKVRVIDTIRSEIWRGTEWRCHRSGLISVSSKVWPFLHAVSIPQERVRLANHKHLCEELVNLGINDTVWYSADPKERTKHLALIKYTGPVPQLGQGYYFGLDLLVILSDILCPLNVMLLIRFRTHILSSQYIHIACVN